jgi:hypothetical protein
MKKIFFIAFLAILSTTPAYAEGGHGGDRGGGGHGGGWGRGGGWGWGGAWIVPALIGGAIVYDLSQPPPVYVQPAPPYAPSSVAPPSVPYWYFCAAANAYYPYVASCPSGWQAVLATPPPPATLPSAPYGAPPQ